MQTAEEIAQSRHQLRRLLMDLLLFVLLTIPITIFEFAIEPARRGFFCDDETIAYPFMENTVTPVALGLLVGLLPLIVFIVVDFVRFYRADVRVMQPLIVERWQAPSWFMLCSKQIAFYVVGMMLTLNATEVGKYTIGRLRPHFLAVCQPQMLDGTTCADAVNHRRYIMDYICAADGYTAVDVRQGRLSFPSGHSSLIFYAMLYTALYLQRQMTWRGSKLLRHILQFSLLMVAWFTALSRVMDSWHHWSDVLIGSMLGIAGAVLTAVYIAKMFKKPTMRNAMTTERNLRLHLPVQHVQNSDVTQPEHLVKTTPPPYSLTSSLHTMDSLRSFSNEQYCAKV